MPHRSCSRLFVRGRAFVVSKLTTRIECSGKANVNSRRGNDYLYAVVAEIYHPQSPAVPYSADFRNAIVAYVERFHASWQVTSIYRLHSAEEVMAHVQVPQRWHGGQDGTLEHLPITMCYFDCNLCHVRRKAIYAMTEPRHQLLVTILSVQCGTVINIFFNSNREGISTHLNALGALRTVLTEKAGRRRCLIHYRLSFATSSLPLMSSRLARTFEIVTRPRRIDYSSTPCSVYRLSPNYAP